MVENSLTYILLFYWKIINDYTCIAVNYKPNCYHGKLITNSEYINFHFKPEFF